MKNELGGKIMTEFVALRPIMMKTKRQKEQKSLW